MITIHVVQNKERGKSVLNIIVSNKGSGPISKLRKQNTGKGKYSRNTERDLDYSSDENIKRHTLLQDSLWKCLTLAVGNKISS